MTTDSARMKSHVELLGWINIVLGVLFLPVALFLFVLLTGLAPVVDDPTATSVLLLIGIAVPALLVVLALPDILAGVGLLKRKAWARPLAMVVGILGVFNFPLGTLVTVYTVWVLTNDEAKSLLGTGD